MRLIDADALLEVLEQDAADNDEWNYVRADGVRDAIMCVHEAPTIEPKTGKWISQDAIFGIVPYVCSECGEKCLDTVMMKPRWNFCPMCGAQMTEGRRPSDRRGIP